MMFTKIQLENLLYGYSNSLYCEGLRKLLEEYHDDIDLTFNEGLLFQIAIGRESEELLNLLLDFYTETMLQDNPASWKYKLVYKKLQTILEEVAESNTLTPQIKAILAPYLAMEEESDNEQDLSSFEDVLDLTNHNVIMHKSHSESDLIQLDSPGSDDTHQTSNLGQSSKWFANFENSETL